MRGEHKRFDAMAERIETGGRGEPRRQAQRQFRIGDGALGDEVRRDEAELPAIIERQQRGAADLGAGSGGGRNGDQRRDLAGDAIEPAIDHGVLLKRHRVRREQRHALGEIDGRAAAKRHQAVAALGLVHGERRKHGGFGGVGRGIDKDRRALGEEGQSLAGDPGGNDTLVGHQQRALQPEFGHRVLQRGQRADPEIDGSQIGNTAHYKSP